ncbi:hypothetical protein B0H21DRAFT_893308 [Amylocystis lapponica]|nr:hypothetical protein B0H21DRAFT_893308 [Amylocystis lapponica]
MTEEPAQIAREAKQNHHDLKEALKTHNPWDRDVEFTRKSLRRHYLRLIFIHPYTTESKDAETHLWMQTSYAFITEYKRRISHLDNTLTNSRQPQQQQSRQHGGHGVVEYRKVLQRFRQFLAEEEKFWIQLITRIRHVFALDNARRALTTLGIAVEDEAFDVALDGTRPRRNPSQFPAEADVVSPALSSATSAQRESKIAMLSKALVCLGDIERYKEQYNEAGGRPRAGHEDGPPAATAPARNGRGRRGGAAGAAQVLPRMRNYDKALQCYEQARLLLPHDGNPSHQMAILASYQKDTFGSLVHYYRALCARRPYDTASENLGSVLSRALEAWKARGAQRDREREKEWEDAATPIAPRLRVDAFKERLIVLHALWRIPADEMEAVAPNHSQKVIKDFTALVSERIVPIDMITKVVIMAQGALWRHRMSRHPAAAIYGNNAKKAALAASAAVTESHIATHLLRLHRVLLEIGIVELAEAPAEDAAEQDLAQRITATFRRTLPALRLSGKWAAAPSTEHTQDGVRERNRRTADQATVAGIPEFWQSYASFSTALLRAFPPEKLPACGVPFEEDVEFTGFMPLKRPLGRTSSGKPTREEVHPNVEQLMRILDLLTDAKVLADAECPILLRGDQFTVEGTEDITKTQLIDDEYMYTDAPTRRPEVPSVLAVDKVSQHELTDTDEDNMTDTTRTDDDPVRDAFREVLSFTPGDDHEENEEDEEDIVVWDPRASVSPRISPMPTVIPVSPIRSKPTSPAVISYSPRAIEPRSPQFDHTGADTTPSLGTKPLTTAQDLLMGLQRTSNTTDGARTQHKRVPSVPQSQLLFGSGTANSIWSTALDSSPIKYTGAAGTTTVCGDTLCVSQPQNHSTGHVPFGTPTQHQIQASNSWHSRTPSQSLARPQMTASQGPGQPYDPFGLHAPPVVPSSPLYSNGVPDAYTDPVYSTSRSTLQPQYHSGYQENPMPLHHDFATVRGPSSLYPSLRSVSQLWANPG